MINIGQPAPDFTLFDSEKKAVTLSDYHGKKNVLLLFFPLAFTGTCTKELCSVRDHIGEYDMNNTEVFGISVDSTYALARYKEDQQFNYSLLSDFNKGVSALYGSLYESFSAMGLKGVSKRSAFIIDRQGLIRYVEVLEVATDIPDFQNVSEVLSTLN